MASNTCKNFTYFAVPVMTRTLAENGVMRISTLPDEMYEDLHIAQLIRLERMN